MQPIEEDHADWTDSDTNSNASNKTLSLPKRVMECNRNNELCSKIHSYLANSKGLEKPEVYLKSLRVENGLLIKENRLWVANEDQLQLKVVEKIHDQLAVGHPGTEKTLEIAQRHYYWPEMKEMIQQFIRNRHVCKQAKIVQDTYHGLLQPLPVPERAWTDITIDYVVELPKCKVYGQIYDAILMVIN